MLDNSLQNNAQKLYQEISTHAESFEPGSTESTMENRAKGKEDALV